MPETEGKIHFFETQPCGTTCTILVSLSAKPMSAMEEGSCQQITFFKTFDMSLTF